MSTITISALGSRGDVQPIVALGAALVARGHVVRVATHARFAALVRGAGLEHFATAEAFDSEVVWASPAGLRLAETRDPILYGFRHFRQVRPHLEQHLAELRNACAGADLLLGLQTVEMASAPVARALGLPYVPLFLSPPDPRFYHPPVVRDVAPRVADLAARLLGHRRAFGEAVLHVLGDAMQRPLITLRDGEGDGGGLALVGISDVVVRRPLDWEARIVTTGYWFDGKAPAPLAPSLEAFLAAGTPPVCIGFGSMPDRDPHAVARTAIEAAERAGARLVVVGGWEGGRAAEAACREANAERVLWVREASHAALFARVAAVVHHGGAGTTAAALLAGVPSMAVPHFGDQFFWGGQIERIGAGPAPLPRHKLGVVPLAQRLAWMLTTDETKKRAKTIGAALRAERGAERAAEILDRAFSGWRRLAGWRATAGAEKS